MLLGILLSVVIAFGGECATPEADAAYRSGFNHQKEARSTEALAAYEACLKQDPSCVACQYEQGWSYWSRSDWANTIKAWEKALVMDPNHAASQTWLPQARDNAAGRATKHTPAGLRVPVGTESTEEGPIKLQLAARFQNYNASPSNPTDYFDEDVYSPKSARFSKDGSKVYVNSLEGYTTIVYDAKTRKKRGVIRHEFDAQSSAMFGGESTVFGYPICESHRRATQISSRANPLKVPFHMVASTFGCRTIVVISTWVPPRRRQYRSSTPRRIPLSVSCLRVRFRNTWWRHRTTDGWW